MHESLDHEANRKQPVKTVSPWAWSLRALLATMTAIFVVGYQQYQIHQLRHQVRQLVDSQEKLAKANAQQVQPSFAPTPVIIRRLPQSPDRSSPFSPVVIPAPRQPQGTSRFPIEVERAMMGDALNAGPGMDSLQLPQVR